ncbi:MAG: hypothetical protein L6Q97_23785 [Thermoanaerobaculia bacterium]|nr:hypothetical protein [Thermoanaerobaculia bacterium]
MNYLLRILPFILLPLFANAQKSLDYTISKPYPVIDAGQKLYFANPAEEKALSIKMDGKDVYLQTFDAKAMKEVKRNKYNDLPKDFVFEHATWFQDKLYFFYSLLEREKEPTKKMYAREIDFDNSKFMDNGRLLFSIEGKEKDISKPLFGQVSVETAGAFSFHLSKDKSKLLIQYRKAPKVKSDKSNYDVIGMYVFGTDLNLIAGNDIKMPYTEKKMDNVDYTIDSEGNPYLLAKVYKDDSTKDTKGKGENRKANYFMELFKVDVGNKSVKTTKIEVKDNFIKDSWIYEGDENTIYCAGFYNKMAGGFNRGDNADGLFLIRLNKDGGMADKNFYEIPLEVLNQYTKAGGKPVKEKKEKDDKAEFDYLELVELVIQKDGSILIIGEQSYLEVSTSQRGVSYYTLHRNDMLISKINPDGQLAWMKKLPKRQAGNINSKSLGFKRLSYDGAHCLFFVDNDKNLNLGLNERPARHIEGLGGFLTAYIIDDQSGTVQKKMVLNPAKLKNGMEVFQLGLNRIVKISDSSCFIEFYKKSKEDVFLKLNLK